MATRVKTAHGQIVYAGNYAPFDVQEKNLQKNVVLMFALFQRNSIS